MTISTICDTPCLYPSMSYTPIAIAHMPLQTASPVPTLLSSSPSTPSSDNTSYHTNTEHCCSCDALVDRVGVLEDLMQKGIVPFCDSVLRALDEQRTSISVANTRLSLLTDVLRQSLYQSRQLQTASFADRQDPTEVVSSSDAPVPLSSCSPHPPLLSPSLLSCNSFLPSTNCSEEGVMKGRVDTAVGDEFTFSAKCSDGETTNEEEAECCQTLSERLKAYENRSILTTEQSINDVDALTNDRRRSAENILGVNATKKLSTPANTLPTIVGKRGRPHKSCYTALSLKLLRKKARLLHYTVP
eukprot:GHVQ01039592.1.p1 GENE.GHVQ01039592.1~~GHVQ01039592.1.p1  ORF type:complete len:301 (+),score=57.42 GHVQ01039592.1:338-1240(+)